VRTATHSPQPQARVRGNTKLSATARRHHGGGGVAHQRKGQPVAREASIRLEAEFIYQAASPVQPSLAVLRQAEFIRGKKIRRPEQLFKAPMSRSYFYGRMMQRKPRWQVEVSIGCAMRAAGR
jgi:hypothetical protein